MKSINTLPKIVAILFFIVSVSSCDEDFNTIAADIIGNEDLLTQSYTTENITSFSRLLDPVQTNVVPVHRLGIYNDQVFGLSKSNYLNQLTLSEIDPVFGDTLGQPINFEKAILHIPFFSESSTVLEGDDDITTYTLDSVFGNSPINISIYESNYFLRDLDPDSNFQEPQLYYSNQSTEFENNLGALLLEIENFVPSNEGFMVIDTIIADNGDEIIDTTMVAPGIRVELPKELFQEKIFDKEGSQELSSNNNFKEYFRGLYFKVESLSDNGTMFIFNPEDASISLDYDYELPELDNNGYPVLDDDGNAIINTIDETFLLNFGGIGLNTFQNELPSIITTELENQDIINGEDNLYIRGGEGIVAVLNIFSGVDEDGNGVSDELDELRIRELLVHDANLRMYVNQEQIIGGSTEPERIIIYDIENNTVLVDYFLDTTNGNVALDAVTNHLGRLKRGIDNLGEYYDINLTNHISNLINKDSTNVSLGLTVSQNVLVNGFQVLDTTTNPEGNLPRINEFPRSSLISPEGTILYGNNTPNSDKKLKLEIKYLDPN